MGRLRVAIGDARWGDARKLAIWTRGEPHDVVLGAGIRVSGAVDHLGQPIDVPIGSRQRVTDAPLWR